MKQYRSYIRAVILSVVAAFAIDMVVNSEDYKAGWTAVVKHETSSETRSLVIKPKLPAVIGNISVMISGVIKSI